MKYKEQLLSLILDQNEDAMMDWIAAQPLLDQPDILRELKALVEEAEQQAGIQSEGFADFEAHIDKYEDSILDEKLAEANLAMALEERDKMSREIDEATDGVRRYVIECIITDAPNAKEMRVLAQKIMDMEKTSGVYNPENWKEIL